jgi:chloramphenicol-sensitive protein RarD
MQYIAPSCMFVMAVFIFNEPFIKVQFISFVMIWTALGIYSADSFVYHRKRNGVMA